MEERKRPAHDHSDAAPPLKRQATATNGASKSHGENEMPWKDDLERFQKDAIYRQMQEYKREKTGLETSLRELKKKTRDHDDHLRTIDAWLEQLIDEMKSLIKNDEDVDMETTDHPSSLLFPKQEEFQKHLQSRAEDIKLIISRLYGQVGKMNPDVVTLQSRVSQLLAAEKSSSAELETLRSQMKETEERLETAIMRYMLAEKKIDRAKSVTAAKLDNGLMLGGSGKVSGDDSGAVKRDDGAVNGNVDHSEEMVELEQEIKKTQAGSEKQKEQISKLEDENARLNTTVTELSTKSLALSDDDYAKTELYKQLKSQHDDVVARINNLEATNTELKEENSKISGERANYQARLEAELRQALSEKDSVLGRTEADLARIRSNRDELLADRDIKKATLEQDQEALKKLKALVSAQEDRIGALESENGRLSTASKTSVDSAELVAMGADELRDKYQELKTKYELLTGELSSMQTAFQKTSKLATQKVSDFAAMEEKIGRLAAEKSKADQKYFAAMKSKETRDSEIRTLRMQNAKSSEVIAQLKEADGVSRALAANLEKQLAEFKDALNSKVSEHRSVSQQNTTHGLEISRLSAQLNEVKQQLAAKDTKLATTSSACRTAEVEVEELKTSLQDTRKNLESWKSKSGQTEQYEMLRMIAYCNICKKRLKDTVMTLCGHTFCHECVEDRFRNRARKCPNCSKAFGQKDFMKITL